MQKKKNEPSNSSRFTQVRSSDQITAQVVSNISKTKSLNVERFACFINQ